MPKRKAKADLPKNLRTKAHCPILLIAGEASEELMNGLSTLDLNVVYLKKNMDIYEKLLWAADFMLALDSDGEKYLNDAWQNGVIPIVKAGVARTLDYDPLKETGNSFVFNGNGVFYIFAAIVRALETFKFPHDWDHLMSQAREGL